MISRAIALTTAVVVAGYAEAQTIVTRSGEHEDFTRLVMRLPEGVEWSLTQNENVATVNVGSPTSFQEPAFNQLARTAQGSRSGSIWDVNAALTIISSLMATL